MFGGVGDITVRKLTDIKKKINRIRWFKQYMNIEVKNMMVNTYVFSKACYGSVITWDWMPKTQREKIKRALRVCAKKIRGINTSTETKFFETVTCFERMGLRCV